MLDFYFRFEFEYLKMGFRWVCSIWLCFYLYIFIFTGIVSLGLVLVKLGCKSRFKFFIFFLLCEIILGFFGFLVLG